MAIVQRWTPTLCAMQQLLNVPVKRPMAYLQVE
ncbi:hypothetical protein MAR_008763 [Mya arenaria]|uniref:Uncharacterized protein n=1 Tax=Mya arenaria TaxID=6604 RepID=A0ABY7DXK7_MYAAR|nr:hypothetical protein MAR_008763 [Mya arenaria]